MRNTAVFASIVASVASVVLATIARADVEHVVARGHTLEAIAHRYHVTVAAIVDANHLKDAQHLKVGETLRIPGVEPPREKGAKDKKGGKNGTYAMRAKTPGVIHVTRLATNEDYVIRATLYRGKLAPASAKASEQMMRSMGGLSHPPEPRLIALLGAMSNHFGSRRVEVISGFRPFTSTQHTAHSNHNIGKAIDFRIVGVPNEVVRDYCRTLKNVGCGYYPNSTFVHLDVREKPAFWIDYSKPGEPPRYNAPNLDADEGTSDVGEEAHVPPPVLGESIAPTPPAPAPAPASAPAPALTSPPWTWPGR